MIRDERDPLLGRRLGGRIEIQAPLGAGGMGRVYRGWHTELSRPVAIKVLQTRSADASLAKRLAHEATASRALNHPNCVKVLESGLDPLDGLFYVVLEFIEGRDLSQMVSAGRKLDPRRACSIIIQVCRGLQAAHALKLIHRDVKPGNIMLTRTRTANGTYVDLVKLVDFGIAKSPESTHTSLTGTGNVMGTPGFMSPEQASGQELDSRSDIYAVGVTLYRLLAGDMPFPGEAFAAQVQAMQKDPPLIAGLHKELNRVVLWAMARDREQRCPSAEALVAALQPWSEEASLRGPQESVPFSSSPSAFSIPASKPPPPEFALDIQLPGSTHQPGGTTVERFVVHANDLPPVKPPEAPAAPAPVQSSPSRYGSASPAPVINVPPDQNRREVMAASTFAIIVALTSAVVTLAIAAIVRANLIDTQLATVEATMAAGNTDAALKSLLALEDIDRNQRANKLAQTMLKLYRADAQLPFSTKYALAPSTWNGEWESPWDGRIKVRLRIESVSGSFFRGVLLWKERVPAHISGLHHGNQLVFLDDGKHSSAKHLSEQIKHATVQELTLRGVDGSEQIPFVLTYSPLGISRLGVNQSPPPSH